MLEALGGAGPLLELLEDIEDMRITVPHIYCWERSALVENASVLDAFSALARACKNTQVCGMLMVRPQQRMLHPLPFIKNLSF